MAVGEGVGVFGVHKGGDGAVSLCVEVDRADRGKACGQEGGWREVSEEVRRDMKGGSMSYQQTLPYGIWKHQKPKSSSDISGLRQPKYHGVQN